MSGVVSLNNKRYFTIFTSFLKSFYEELGVPQNATQTEIKSAYYKLSMLYHPDRNQGSKVAAKKFQAVTSAYEVLGNFKKRRLYDRGLITSVHLDNEEELKKTDTDFLKHRPVYTSRQSPVYDFDEWSKSHYGQSFARRTAAKLSYEKKIKAHINTKRDKAVFSILLLLLIFLLLTNTFHNSLDDFKTQAAETNSESDTKNKKN